MKVNRPITAAIKAILAAAPGIATVNAQEAPNASQLQEVLVYGKAEQYRPEDQTSATGMRLPLIDTPQSISVVSDEMLKIWNKQTAYQAADLIPGASQGGQAFGLDRIYLRGQPLNQPRVNGVNFSAGTGTQYLDSYALERVEIVRGPATVLYGVTGAFGGEINQILKKPQAGFHADVGFNGGDFANRRYEGDVTGSVPGTDDRLKVRLVGAYTDFGAPQDTVVAPTNISRLYSGAVTYDFTTNTTGSVYLYKEDRAFDPRDGCPLAQTASGTLYIPSAIAVEHWYCNDPKQSYSTFTQELEQASLSHKFANDWNFLATATHTNAVRTSDYVFGFGPAGAYALPPEDVYLYSYKDRSQQNAVTADVSLGGKFDLLERTQQFFLAVEYQKQDQNRYNYKTFGLGILNMFQDGGLGILANGDPIPLIPTDDPYVGDKIVEFKALRASAQVLLNPVGRLNVLAGALTQHTEQSSSNVRPGKPTLSDTFSDTNTVGRLGVTYGLVANKGPWLSDAKPYFSYSEGFQPNIGVFDAAGNPLTTPQREKSYELGLKTQWIDGHVDAYFAAYHSTDTNLPTTNYGQVGTSGGTFSSVLGGKNTYDGFEMEVLGEILPGWNADLSYSHIKAEQQSLILQRDLAVANVPKDQVALFTSYEFIAGPLKGFLIGGSIVAKSDVPLVGADTAIVTGGYDPNNQVLWSATRVDFVASYKDFAGHLKGLEVSGNVYNAFNSRSYASPEGPGQPGFGNTVGSPRAVTVGVRYHF